MMFDTKNFTLGSNHYCSYCGKEIKGEVEYDEYIASKPYFFCDCENAQKELDILKQIEKLKEQMPKTNTPLMVEMSYNYELNELNRRFGFEF